jgi:predicted lactoylglutathione lyase
VFHSLLACFCMDPRISFVTLGVKDLVRSTQFYSEILGLKIHKSYPEVTFFEMGKTWLALYPADLLASDAGVSREGSGFPRFAMAHNVRSSEEVDALIRTAAAGGGSEVKPGQKTSWGGYSGYFADPDGFLWEVAWNPNFPHM